MINPCWDACEASSSTQADLGGPDGFVPLLRMLPGQPQVLGDHDLEGLLSGWHQVLLHTLPVKAP